MQHVETASRCVQRHRFPFAEFLCLHGFPMLCRIWHVTLTFTFAQGSPAITGSQAFCRGVKPPCHHNCMPGIYTIGGMLADRHTVEHRVFRAGQSHCHSGLHWPPPPVAVANSHSALSVLTSGYTINATKRQKTAPPLSVYSWPGGWPHCHSSA